MRPILLVILVILGKAKDLLGQEKVCPKHTPPETHFLNIHVAVLVATGDKTGDSRSPSRGYFSNWDDTQRRLEVTKTYLSKFNVIANPIALNGTNLPHGRILELKWSSREVTTIRLDQGVGYWRFSKDGRLGFLDHRDSADRQSSDMAAAIRHLGVSGQDFPTQLFIKHRS